MDNDQHVPLLSPKCPLSLTLSHAPENEDISVLTQFEIKDRLIFGPCIDPLTQSSSVSLLETLAIPSTPTPSPSSGSLRSPLLFDSQEYHDRNNNQQILQQTLTNHNSTRKKPNLHRCKTAPARAIINDIVNDPHKNPPQPTSQSIVRQAFLLLLVYLSLGILIYWFNRGQFRVQETHPVVDAFYFCIVTMCTIGYGDITPNSTTTKAFSILFVLVGFGFIDILLSGMVSYVLDLHENYLLKTVKAGEEGEGSLLIDAKKGRMRIRMKVTLALGVVVVCIGIGASVLHYIEALGWLDSFYLSVMSVTTVGYGDRTFTSLSGRAFACIWLLVSTLAVARAFLYLAEARVDKRNRRFAKWVLGQDMTASQFLAADIDNNGFVRYQPNLGF